MTARGAWDEGNSVVIVGAPAPAPRRPVRPPKPALLADAGPAKVRPLGKAEHLGFVRMAGGYGGHVSGGAKATQDFDTRATVEWCVSRGFLTGGPHANTYSLTPKGEGALALWREYQAERAAYAEAMKAWRAANKPTPKDGGAAPRNARR